MDAIVGTPLQVRTSEAATNSRRKNCHCLRMTSIGEGQPVLSSADGAPTVSESSLPRRLTDADVRSIFDCLHHGQQPPRRLPFRIVPVGPGDLKLSPPSHEFPVGLYVLLCRRSPKVPTHLQHLVLDRALFSEDPCPWSLSGPQYSKSTMIQQRYCFPKGRPAYIYCYVKGRPAYKAVKGGAIWTIYDGSTDAREDLKFRLLHVYDQPMRSHPTSMLYYAARNGYVDDVKLLLDDGKVNPGANENLILKSASENGHSEIVRLLLHDKRVYLRGRLPFEGREEFLGMVSTGDLPPSIDVVTVWPDEIHSRKLRRALAIRHRKVVSEVATLARSKLYQSLPSDLRCNIVLDHFAYALFPYQRQKEEKQQQIERMINRFGNKDGSVEEALSRKRNSSGVQISL